MTDQVDLGLPALPDASAEDLQDRHNALTERQQAHRLSTIPEIYKTPHERLACEIALGLEEPDVIFARHGYSITQALALTTNAGFEATVDRISKEIRQAGIPFRAKAKAMAEELLVHAFDIATDPDAATAERVKLIQWVTKVAGLEPKEKELAGSGGGLNLSITFAGQAPVQVVQHEPLTITQEAA